MKGDRKNKYRYAQYQAGCFSMTRCSDGKWIVDRMAEYDGEPGQYDPHTLTSTDMEFDTLREARQWCNKQLGF